MRAGPYATYQGTTYRADYAHGSPARLLVPIDEPQPPGFEKDRYGDWSRRVERCELSATFYVRTTARWKGKLVDVRSVLGEHAYIEYVGTDIDGRPELEQKENGFWGGSVPVDSLTDATEVVIHVP